MKTNARIWIWIVLLLVVVVAVFVISKSKKETDDKMGKNIEYNTIELMQNEEIDLPTEVVIKNSEEWNQYFGNKSSVDFTKKMVVGYSLGARSNGGYSISVDSVTEDSSSITINATSVTPGENCITMQVITFPRAIISINKTTKDVKWKIENVTEDC